MKKRNLFVMGTLSLGLVFATGCGGSQQEQTEEGTAAETSEEVRPRKPAAPTRRRPPTFLLLPLQVWNILWKMS